MKNINRISPIITIITPTYNRAHKLPILYSSLIKQKGHFVWLIVDDGSTDNTEIVVADFDNCNNFEIQYIKKNNGGKHTAVNFGVKRINTPLTMIVDSDDRLLPYAIECIEGVHNKYKKYKNIGMYTFLKCYSSGKNVVSLENDEFIENYIKYRILQDRPGDMAEVFITDVMKGFPFPEFKGERFLSEDVAWIEIGKYFDSVYINQSIYECEYLEDGLTANDKIMKFSSPFGSMMRGKQLMSKECGIKANLKGAIIYNCYKFCIHNRIPEVLILSFREKVLVALTKLISRWYYEKWRN